MSPRLNIIGAGKAGSTLGRLWRLAGIFEIGDVMNTTVASAGLACEFMGGGMPCRSCDSLRPAPVWLIGANDDALPELAARLAQADVVRAGDVVFHLSGALAADTLEALAAGGAHCASLHPAHSFADPAASARDFAGTWCVLEGDAEALGVLAPAVAAIGGQSFELEAADKALYHAALVMASNHLVALIEDALAVLRLAGVTQDVALRLLESLTRGTLENVLRVGPVRALTGPVARGDQALLARQLARLEAADANVASRYRALARGAVALARRQGRLDEASLEKMAALLED